MKLTDEQKKAIEEEHKQYEALQYAGRSKEERQKLGQFYTPPPLSIKMLEKFDSVKDKDILDPTVGAGGLLVAAILAGADPKRVYGVDLDPINVLLARKRLAKYGVPSKHIKLGNALNSDVFEDFDNYEDDVEEKAKEAIAKLKEEDKKATAATQEKKKHKEKTNAVVHKEKKTKHIVSCIKHDQDAMTLKIERIYRDVKLIITEFKFPDVENKKTEISLAVNGKSKKPALKKAAKFLEDKLNNNYWLISSTDAIDDFKQLLALNDVVIHTDDNKILDIKLENLRSIAAQQLFDSFDDFKTLN